MTPPPLPMYHVTGTRVHYDRARGGVWAEDFVTPVFARDATEAMVSVEKDTNGSDDVDCYGLAAVRVSEAV